MFNFLLEGNASGSWVYIVMIVIIIGMFFFMSRSQKKKDREAQQMRDSLAIGDEVTTIGGIIGKIVSIKDETFVLETTKDKTKIRFLKGAIRSIDVKMADVAATVLETKAAAEAPAATEEAQVEAPAATEEAQVEAPTEETATEENK